MEVVSRGPVAFGIHSLQVALIHSFEDDDLIELLALGLVNGHHGNAPLRTGRRGELILNNRGGKKTAGVSIAALRPPSLSQP